MNIATILGILSASFGFLGTSYKFVASNITTILLAIVVIIIAIVIWQGYGIIRQNAQDEILIQEYKQNEQAYQQALAEKDKQIALEKALNDASNKVITDQQTQIKELDDKFNNIVNSDLGKDLNDPAAQSLKNLLQQLEKTLKLKKP